MNHKEKAKELVNSFLSIKTYNTRPIDLTETQAKQCATISVDEIINALKITTGHCELRRLDEQEVQSDLDYWERVKKEIDKL